MHSISCGAALALASRRRHQRWIDAHRWNEFANDKLPRLLGDNMNSQIAMFIALNGNCRTDDEVTRAEAILQTIFDSMRRVENGWEVTFHLEKKGCDRFVSILQRHIKLS